MKKIVLFDMDGTLADTSRGILDSHRYAHKMMGRPVPEYTALSGVIGGPLLDTYINRFNFTPEEAREAVNIYRAFYAEQGVNGVSLYPGIRELLITLKESGYLLGVATLKAERFAKQILKNLEIDDIFDVIHGVDENDTRTKSDLILMCIDDLGGSRENTVLVGDSIHDKNGAEAAGVKFIGVTYGFGFDKNDGMCAQVSEIYEAVNELIKRTKAHKLFGV